MLHLANVAGNCLHCFKDGAPNAADGLSHRAALLKFLDK